MIVKNLFLLEDFDVIRFCQLEDNLNIYKCVI